MAQASWDISAAYSDEGMGRLEILHPESGTHAFSGDLLNKEPNSQILLTSLSLITSQALSSYTTAVSLKMMLEARAKAVDRRVYIRFRNLSRAAGFGRNESEGRAAKIMRKLAKRIRVVRCSMQPRTRRDRTSREGKTGSRRTGSSNLYVAPVPCLYKTRQLKLVQ